MHTHNSLHLGFINIFSNRATGFHKQAKLFELNFFIPKTFLSMVELGRQRHPQS